MSNTRKIRIEYYQVVKANIDGTGVDELYDLRILIDKADKLGIEARTYEYYQEKARLDKCRYFKELDFWYLNFVRLRQSKIPVKAKKDKEAEPFPLEEDEFIGEDVTCVYDCKNHIIALQRNRDSLSSIGLESYLTQLYGNESKGIYLRAVPMADIFERAGKAKVFRKLSLKFASDKTKTRKNVEATSFKGMFHYFDKFENSQNATVSISLGKGKKGTLDGEMIAETLRDIHISDGLVTGATLNIKDREDAPVETIDLFSQKYHSFITLSIKDRESIDFIECGDEICVKYKEKREDILNSIRKIGK